MKMPFSERLRRLQLFLIIAFGTMPFAFVLTGNKAPVLLAWWAMYPGGYFLLAALSLWVPGRRRLGYGIVSGLMGLVCAAVLPSRQEMLVSILTALPYWGVLLWSLRVAGWSSTDEIPGAWLVIGSVLHLAGLLALRADRVAGDPVLMPRAGWMYLCLYLFVLLSMLSLNRKSLTAASGKRQRASIAMRRQNVALTLLLFSLGIAFAFLPSVYRWVKAAALWLWSLFGQLIELLRREDGESAVAAPSMEDSHLPMGGEGEAGPLALLLEKLILVLGAILALACICWLLYRLGKILRKLLRRLLSSLAGFASSASEDYVDEITDTRESDPAGPILAGPVAAWRARQEERSMTPAQRIRYRYGRLSDKHPEWSPGSTARENLPCKPAGLYEQARYSDHPVTAEDAQTFINEIKKI